VRTEIAGPATIGELIDMAGRVEIVPEGKAEVRAVYPGRILMMRGELGQSVRRGQAMARVESSHSLQAYAITAPISGVITEKNANVGGVAGDQPLFVVADPTKLHAEFFVYPRDAERVRVGQPVEVRSLSGEARLTARVEAILPTADLASQTLMAHVHWRCAPRPCSASETLPWCSPRSGTPTRCGCWSWAARRRNGPRCLAVWSPEPSMWSTAPS
jgi:cobalt-zinc-cadmium efflux system membrane fusion protein